MQRYRDIIALVYEGAARRGMTLQWSVGM